MKVIPQLEPQAIFYNRNKFGISRSIEILHSIIDNESEIEKRKVAIKYLGLLKDNSCFPIFENLLVSDENIIIKCEAAKALGRLKLIRGLKPLKWALENNSINNELKKHILRAIEKIRFEDSEIKLFIKHLNCQDKSIKTCIKNRLINLGPLRLINILLEFLKVKNIPENYEITLVKLMGYELSMLSNNNLMVLNKIHDSDEDSVKNLLENKDFLVELLTSVFEEDDYQLLKSTLLILKYLGPKIENILINFLYKEDIEPIIKKNA
ncbi:MAG: HEAT repeat domain-containing protein, partial [Promethearchaeota archaeon]